MFSAIIEAIASTLAEYFAGKAAQNGLQKMGKARGWVALGVLLALIIFLVWLGIYLVLTGVWPIAVLMFAIAAMMAYITAASVIKTRKKKQ